MSLTGRQTVVLGQAGVHEVLKWYVGIAKRAAAVAAQRQAKMLVLIDFAGMVAVAESPPQRRHWCIAEVTHKTDPDVLARKIERTAIDRGFDEGGRYLRWKGRGART